jgi:hypothetical protein
MKKWLSEISLAACLALTTAALWHGSWLAVALALGWGAVLLINTYVLIRRSEALLINFEDYVTKVKLEMLKEVELRAAADKRLELRDVQLANKLGMRLE